MCVVCECLLTNLFVFSSCCCCWHLRTRYVYPLPLSVHLLLILWRYFGQSQQYHGELLAWDLAMLVVSNATHNCLLECGQILCIIVILEDHSFVNVCVIYNCLLSVPTFLTSSSRSLRKPFSSSFSIVPLLSCQSIKYIYRGLHYHHYFNSLTRS